MEVVLSVVDREYTYDMDKLIKEHVSSRYTTIIPNSNVRSYTVSERIFKSIDGIRLKIYIPASFDNNTKRFDNSISGCIMNCDELKDFRDMISSSYDRIQLILCDSVLDAQKKIMEEHDNFLMFGPIDIGGNVNAELMKLASDRTRDVRLTYM